MIDNYHGELNFDLLGYFSAGECSLSLSLSLFLLMSLSRSLLLSMFLSESVSEVTSLFRRCDINLRYVYHVSFTCVTCTIHIATLS